MPTEAEELSWRRRQDEMERYYRGLVLDPTEARLSFRDDYKRPIPIGEGELGDWLGLDYRVEDRRWRGAYLSYLLKRAG